MSWLFVGSDGKQVSAVNSTYVPQPSSSSVASSSNNSVSAQSSSHVAVSVAPAAPTYSIKVSRPSKPITTIFPYCGTMSCTSGSAVSVAVGVFSSMMLAPAWTSLSLLYDEYCLNSVEMTADFSDACASSGIRMLATAYDPNSTSGRAWATVNEFTNSKIKNMYGGGNYCGVVRKFTIGNPLYVSGGIVSQKWQDCATATGISYGSVLFASDRVAAANGTMNYVIKFNVSFRSRKY